MRIIPAIDIIGGKCVRLTQGAYEQKKIYNENPLEVALQFEDAGIRFLHLVDLDGAKKGTVVNHKILNQIASKTQLKIDFGGGVKTDTGLKIAFENGANQVTGGSIAVNNPELFLTWLNEYGSEKIILGADVIQNKIATHAWQETSDREVLDFLKYYVSKGIKYSICTDVSKDGMLQGPSFQLYQDILSATNLKLIASGGVSQIEDIYKLREIGCEGVIIGKAIYENKISINNLTKFL